MPWIINRGARIGPRVLTPNPYASKIRLFQCMLPTSQFDLPVPLPLTFTLTLSFAFVCALWATRGWAEAVDLDGLVARKPDCTAACNILFLCGLIIVTKLDIPTLLPCPSAPASTPMGHGRPNACFNCETRPGGRVCDYDVLSDGPRAFTTAN